MKFYIFTLLKLFLGVFFVLTSIYCLLAFIPYTHLFLIKAAPYPWLTAFSRYHTLLYWCATAAALFAYWPRRQKSAVLGAGIALAVMGILFTVENFLPNIRNNWTAYIASVAVLVPLALLASVDVSEWGSSRTESSQCSLFAYSNALLVAFSVATLSIISSNMRVRLDPLRLTPQPFTLDLALYVEITYICFALMLVSIMNLIGLVVGRFVKASRNIRLFLGSTLMFVGLALASTWFLQDSLTFRGWPTYIFSFLLAGSLTLWELAVFRPLLDTREPGLNKRRIFLYILVLCMAVLTLIIPDLIGETDWNGVLRGGFTLLMWILLVTCIFFLRPRYRNYSAVASIAVLLAAGFGYWGITATAFLWAKPLGKTDGEVARTMEIYADSDVSFGMVHHLFTGVHNEPCGDLCRTLRQYTNIRNAEAKVDLNLVDPLVPTTQDGPNIFMIVVDSVRRDYLGAYNPRVNFTPNLDAFARDCVVERNAYTQYAGTALSEPAIWAGALLLHAQYMQPFSRVNSLEKLVTTDGYRMVVSYDDVLSVILSKNPDLVQLDAGRAWNEFELSATLQQLESFLDSRHEPNRPIFFYAQPKNVHLMARNQLSRYGYNTWTPPTGFNKRISFELHQVDEILGHFFAYLKAHGLYDNSIIVITADHGDATGEFGRQGHSLIIYPEVMRIPLLIHLPKQMKGQFVHDPEALATLTDLTPTLYYLLGHKPVKDTLLFGHPLFVQTKQELQAPKHDIFLASDSRAAYGLLEDHARWMYTTYDSPPSSFLFDLSDDPHGTTNVLTDSLKKQYDARIIEYLRQIAAFYDYRPTGSATSVTLR